MDYRCRKKIKRSPQELMPEEQLRQAKLKALRLLERMDRTEAQLREKLLQAEFDPEMVEKAIAYVKSLVYTMMTLGA